MGFFSKIIEHLNPSLNPDIESAFSHQAEYLPTLWLLGKTGAGKSSLIQTITGDSTVEIGNGFRPCTRTSLSFDFPTERPVLRFLDTRGLAEANYDAKDDIAACENRSHALIVVMKAEEPEQSSVLNALKQIQKSGFISQLLVVHTGIFLISDDTARLQCIAHNQFQIKEIWKKEFAHVAVDFALENSEQSGLEELRDKLAEMLPLLAQINRGNQYASQEEKNFAQLKSEILWYSSVAGGSDAIPAVGLVSVPAIQAKMIHSLANQYGVEWNRRVMSEFVGTLGTGFGIQYMVKLGVRQGIKMIPAYGQTVGAATAAVMSFCTTYAIGRVVCKYLYHKSKGEVVSEEEMKTMYKQAFDSVKEAAKSETIN